MTPHWIGPLLHRADGELLTEPEIDTLALDLFEQGLSTEMVICCTGLSASQIVKLRQGKSE